MTEIEQIQEMAKDLCHTYACEIRKSGIPCNHRCKAHIYATRAIAKGYRKVERGEWRPYPKIKGKVTPEAVCSLCGCMCVYLLVNDRYELAHYCPKCGADMRGEK